MASKSAALNTAKATNSSIYALYQLVNHMLGKVSITIMLTAIKQPPCLTKENTPADV